MRGPGAGDDRTPPSSRAAPDPARRHYDLPRGASLTVGRAARPRLEGAGTQKGPGLEGRRWTEGGAESADRQPENTGIARREAAGHENAVPLSLRVSSARHPLSFEG